MKNAYDPGQAQTLTEHLTELRNRIIRSGLAIAVAAGACWFFTEEIFNLVRGPVTPFLPAGGLIFTSPADKFVVSVKLALLGGVVFSCPVWIYQIWMFIAPGLYSNERRYSLAFISGGTLLFALGVAFSYFLALPTALEFLLNFGGSVDKPMITITEYMSFFMTMTLVFGGAFELPLILVLLGAIGVVDQKMLRDKRRYAIVILAFLSAVITPPDILSMSILLVPLWLLYEISVLLVGVVGGKAKAAPVTD